MKEKGRAAYYKMLESVRQGELIQIRRGLYANIDQLSNSMIDIEAIIPGGILCSWSALEHPPAYDYHATSLSYSHKKGPKSSNTFISLNRTSPLYSFYTGDWCKQDVFGGLQYQDLRHRPMRM